LNTVPFGDNAFGIKVASQRFFNKGPDELTAEEAAVLIGLLKGNTSYNPRLNPEAALKRRNLVLRRMSAAGHLPTGTLDSLQQIPLTLDYRPEAHNRGLATYFREHLRHELKAILEDYPGPEGKPYDLYRDGLKIYTTIDSRVQAHAEAAVLEVLPQLQANLATDWKKYKTSPWESAFQNHLKKSDRYRKVIKRGLNNEAAMEQLRQPAKMTVLDWQRGGAVDTTLSPLDSLRHYFIQLNAGLLAAEPSTGLVRAWVGGGDHRFVQYDHVKSRRQIGSTIKPIVYAAALQEGMRPCEYTPAERFTYEDYNNYNPGNPSGEYEGVYSMRGGLAKSVNTVAVNIAVRTGLDQVVDFTKQLGLSQEVKPIPSLALGTAEASLWEMVPAYATFANGGRRPDRLHYLDRIETADGEIIVEFEKPNAADFEEVMTDSVAQLATFLLSGVVNNGTAARLRSRHGLRGAIAAKTGTTQDQSDGWLLGFTPKLVVGSWVGAEYPAVHFRTLSRGSSTATALPLWGNFMRRVVRDKSLKSFQGGNFPALDELTLAYLQCPDYLEEMPIISDSMRQDVMAREIDPMELEAMMQRKPRRRNESAADYLARMERALEKEGRKDERRKKRKEFFRELFFNKDD
ncbi:MAG: penicillin-binding transpeptidase domain-containing protein, partial [Bacteroidota bacterium]